KRSIERKRDEVSLRFMQLAEFTIGISSCGIEISQNCPCERMGRGVPAQRALNHQLRLAVGINRKLRGIFRNWKNLWNAISGASGRKNDVTHTCFESRIKQSQRTNHIVVKVAFGVLHGFANIRET